MQLFKLIGWDRRRGLKNRVNRMRSAMWKWTSPLLSHLADHDPDRQIGKIPISGRALLPQQAPGPNSVTQYAANQPPKMYSRMTYNRVDPDVGELKSNPSCIS
jgi:hypothetical protein